MFTVQTMPPISWPGLIPCCQNYCKLQPSVMLRQWAWGQIALSFPHKSLQQEISCSLTQHLSNSLSLSFALSLCASDFVSECLPFMTLSLHGMPKFKTYVPGTWVHVRTQHKYFPSWPTSPKTTCNILVLYFPEMQPCKQKLPWQTPLIMSRGLLLVLNCSLLLKGQFVQWIPKATK